MQNSTPSIGFVSLGCPKNLVDSERILTELRTDGYNIVPSYENVDLVIVNTCGFIDSAVQESLEAIGEALEENGRVIVTGCLGAKEDQIREVHPKVLEVSGPHSYEAVMAQVHKYVPKPTHSPYTSLVPKQGVKLTPKHYAYLKISEGCDHRCTFCIIPSMRGDLESRSTSFGRSKTFSRSRRKRIARGITRYFRLFHGLKTPRGWCKNGFLEWHAN